MLRAKQFQVVLFFFFFFSYLFFHHQVVYRLLLYIHIVLNSPRLRFHVSEQSNHSQLPLFRLGLNGMKTCKKQKKIEALMLDALLLSFALKIFTPFWVYFITQQPSLFLLAFVSLILHAECFLVRNAVLTKAFLTGEC